MYFMRLAAWIGHGYGGFFYANVALLSVCAFVVLKPDSQPSEEMKKVLQEYVKQAIAPYKYPRQIEFMDSLPRTETGKVQRFKLRKPT